MTTSTNPATYRLRKFSRKGDMPKNYSGSYEILDEQTQQVMAYCDLTGYAIVSAISILENNATWTMKPNRKILPTRWIITDPVKSVAMQFDRNLLKKMKNPIHRVILTLLNGQDEEVYHLVDPREDFADRVLGVGPDDWLLMKEDQPVARVTNLVRYKEQPVGFLQKMKAFLTPTDKGFVSLKGIHVLPAPITLAMLLILHDITASSSSDKL